MSKDDVCEWRYESDEFGEGYITSCGYAHQIKKYEGDRRTIQGDCLHCRKPIRVIEEEKDET